MHQSTLPETADASVQVDIEDDSGSMSPVRDPDVVALASRNAALANKLQNSLTESMECRVRPSELYPFSSLCCILSH